MKLMCWFFLQIYLFQMQKVHMWKIKIETAHKLVIDVQKSNQKLETYELFNCFFCLVF